MARAGETLGAQRLVEPEGARLGKQRIFLEVRAEELREDLLVCDQIDDAVEREVDFEHLLRQEKIEFPDKEIDDSRRFMEGELKGCCPRCGKGKTRFLHQFVGFIWGVKSEGNVGGESLFNLFLHFGICN